ncbi:MAG: tRNA (N(6)-L-threonylcarbamoyladenosine(37)-C(2))-methylthiotransferase MtaB [Alphaproteobacteria bacterium]
MNGPAPAAGAGEPTVLTFGCRLNAWESDVIRRHALAAGLTDAAIVNTCAVTAEATRQARQAVRRLHRDAPSRPLIVTGCAAQLDPAVFAAMPGVSHVLGNAEKLRPASWRALTGAHGHAADPSATGARTARTDVADIMTDTTVPMAPADDMAGDAAGAFDGRARAFLAIQHGCDHRCTFCIIPFARGQNRSLPMADIVRRARDLLARGFADVVLTGVDLTSWGHDLAGRPTLGNAVADLLERVPELNRLRLSSLDPGAIDEPLHRVFASEPRLLAHLHLSVQAGDDMVLKRMKRRHLRHHVLELVARLRAVRPEAGFGADLIAGFPTETAPMADNSLALVHEAGLAFLHVFPYSARPGTPAARMPQVAVAERRARAARLRRAGDQVLAAFHRQRLGRAAEVLVETANGDGGGDGRGGDGAIIRLGHARPDDVGRVVRARIIAMGDGRLLARRTGLAARS